MTGGVESKIESVDRISQEKITRATCLIIIALGFNNHKPLM